MANSSENPEPRPGQFDGHLEGIRAAPALPAPPSRVNESIDKAIIAVCELLGLLFGLPFGEDLYRNGEITLRYLLYLAIGILFAAGGPVTVHFLRRPSDHPSQKTDARRAMRLFMVGWYAILLAAAIILLWWLNGSDNNSLLLALIPFGVGAILISTSAISTGAYIPTIKSFASQRRRTMLLWSSITILAVLFIEAHRLQSEFDTYVSPRTISDRQANDLKNELSKLPKRHVTVKVNSLNQEATSYAGQLNNVFTKAGWDSSFDTSDAQPQPLDTGVCLTMVGEGEIGVGLASKIAEEIQAAFRSAHLSFNCGGRSAAGTFGIYFLVGQRPLKVLPRPSIFREYLRYWIQYWLMTGLI